MASIFYYIFQQAYYFRCTGIFAILTDMPHVRYSIGLNMVVLNAPFGDGGIGPVISQTAKYLVFAPNQQG